MGMVPRRIKRSGFVQGVKLGFFLVMTGAALWIFAHIVIEMGRLS